MLLGRAGRSVELRVDGRLRRHRMAGQDEVVGLPVEDGALRKDEVLRRDHMTDQEVGHVDLDLRRDVGGLDLEGDRVLVHDDHDVAGVLTDRDELHLDGDLLAATHDDEVDVLDVAVDRVLLDLFRQRELLLAALDVDLEEHVRDAQRELGLVARKADVYGIGAVAVQHGRHLVRATQTTCCALAEFGALRGAQSDLVGHGDSPQPRMSMRPCRAEARPREDLVDHGWPETGPLAEATPTGYRMVTAVGKRAGPSAYRKSRSRNCPSTFASGSATRVASRSRSSTRRILPEIVFGSSLTNSMSRSRACSKISLAASCGLAAMSRASVTNAFGTASRTGSGLGTMPTPQ